MSTAVIISGEARSFAQTYAQQRWTLFRHLDDPYFFVSINDDAQAADMDRLKADFKNVFIERVTQPDLPEPEEFLKAALHAPYGNIVPLRSVLRQHWAHKRSWQWFKKCAGGLVNQFDTFVRVRPDSFFHRIHLPENVELETVYTAWWGSYGGINDRFAWITGQKAATIYFNLIDAIPQLVADGCAFHPETLMGAWLDRAGVPISRTLDAEFTTKRIDGKPDTMPVYYASDIFRYMEKRLEPYDRLMEVLKRSKAAGAPGHGPG